MNHKNLLNTQRTSSYPLFFLILKGLLALEGELTPVLVSLVNSDKHVTDMLDTPVEVHETMLK